MKKNLLIVLLLTVSTLSAAPTTIRFQGRLTDANGRPITGPSVQVRFAVFNVATNGSSLWQGPANQTVETNDAGLFSTDIGPVPINIISDNSDLYLQVSVNDGTGFKNLLPRQKLASVPYAMRSEYAVTAATTMFVAENAVSNLSIQTGAIESRHFKTGAVDAAALANDAVTSNKILNGEVKNSDIEVSTITRDRLSATSFEDDGAGLVPQDAILMFMNRTTCPAGYSEVKVLRSKFPLGADLDGILAEVPDTVGETVGTLTHNHSIVHTHGIGNAIPGASELAGYNNSSGERCLSGGKLAQCGQLIGGGAGEQNNLRGIDHSHNTVSQNISESGLASSLPPAVTVIFCSKN